MRAVRMRCGEDPSYSRPRSHGGETLFDGSAFPSAIRRGRGPGVASFGALSLSRDGGGCSGSAEFSTSIHVRTVHDRPTIFVCRVQGSRLESLRLAQTAQIDDFRSIAGSTRWSGEVVAVSELGVDGG